MGWEDVGHIVNVLFGDTQAGLEGLGIMTPTRQAQLDIMNKRKEGMDLENIAQKNANDLFQKEQTRQAGLWRLNRARAYAMLGDANNFHKSIQELSKGLPDGGEYVGTETDPDGVKVAVYKGHDGVKTRMRLDSAGMRDALQKLEPVFADPVAYDKAWTENKIALTKFNNEQEFSPLDKDSDFRIQYDTTSGKKYYQIRDKQGNIKIADTIPRTLAQKMGIRKEELSQSKTESEIAENYGSLEASRASARASDALAKQRHEQTSALKSGKRYETYTSDGSDGFEEGTLVQHDLVTGRKTRAQAAPPTPIETEDAVSKALYDTWGIDRGNAEDRPEMDDKTAGDVRLWLRKRGFDATFTGKKGKWKFYGLVKKGDAPQGPSQGDVQTKTLKSGETVRVRWDGKKWVEVLNN